MLQLKVINSYVLRIVDAYFSFIATFTLYLSNREYKQKSDKKRYNKINIGRCTISIACRYKTD